MFCRTRRLQNFTDVRTLCGRSDGSDVITKPKFLAVMGLPNSLSYAARAGAPLLLLRERNYDVVAAAKYWTRV